MKRWRIGRILQLNVLFRKLWFLELLAILLTLWYFQGWFKIFLSKFSSFNFSFILSRPCVKSSTNIFLSLLAFADTSFLVFIYVSSIRYHHNVNHQEYEIYWRMFGLSQWFYTAFSEFWCVQTSRCIQNQICFISFISVYISVYLTLSLALDQFDAVRHPTRTTKCGIARAKNVVSSKLFFLFPSCGDSTTSPSFSCALSTSMWTFSSKFLIQFGELRKVEKLSFNVVLDSLSGKTEKQVLSSAIPIH